MFRKTILRIMSVFMAVSGLLLVASPALAYSHASTVRYNLTRAGHIHRRFSFSISFAPTAPEVNPATPLTAEANSSVNQASPAVVYINTYKDTPTYVTQYFRQGNLIYANKVQTGTANQEVSSGSGFFITSDGYILTNKHVVSDTNATYQVVVNGNSVPAQVVYRDDTNDLAIVKIDGNNYPTLSLGDSSSVTAGQNVVAIGNALGKYTNLATQGTITALDQTVSVSGDNGVPETLQNVFQTSAQLYPGDSGGPLLNTQGQVIAVNTATTVGSWISAGYSIPINVAKTVIAQAGITLP